MLTPLPPIAYSGINFIDQACPERYDGWDFLAKQRNYTYPRDYEEMHDRFRELDHYLHLIGYDDMSILEVMQQELRRL